MRRGNPMLPGTGGSCSDSTRPLASMRPSVTYTVPRLSAPPEHSTSNKPYIGPRAARSSRMSCSFLGSGACGAAIACILHKIRSIKQGYFTSSRSPYTRPLYSGSPLINHSTMPAWSRLHSFTLLPLMLTAQCGQPASPSPSASDVAAFQATIQHLVVIIKENRSFDNLFGTFPGAD